MCVCVCVCARARVRGVCTSLGALAQGGLAVVELALQRQPRRLERHRLHHLRPCHSTVCERRGRGRAGGGGGVTGGGQGEERLRNQEAVTGFSASVKQQTLSP